MNIKKSIILVLIISAFGAAGCTIVKNKTEEPPKVSPTPTPEAEKKISPEDDRDNQRINDIMNISAALESYASSNVKTEGPYPETKGVEKISDESSAVFKQLNQDGYLKQILKDPLPDKYYYGYSSDGFAYELTAVLENKASGLCIMAGNYCIYKFTKGKIGIAPTPETGQ